MKKLVFIFMLLLSLQTIYAQKQKSDRPDPVPQTSKPTPRDTMPEEKLWETAVNKFEHTELDSSSGNTTRRIAKFEGIKFQLRMNNGNLQVVNSWEYRLINTQHGNLVLYIFTLQNKQKNIVSLRPMIDYKKIMLIFQARGYEPISIAAYTPNADLTKITILY